MNAGTVRAGLVAVGAAIAIVGAGIVIAVGLPVETSGHTSHASASAFGTVVPGAWFAFSMNATPADEASESFAWSANGSVEVQWYAADPGAASGPCSVPAPPLATWANTSRGEWNGTGAAPAIYCVWVHDTAGHPLNFTGQFHEEAVDPPLHLPTLLLAWLVIGGSLLAGIGGIAVYLGLFLPTDVYGGNDEEYPVDEDGIIDDMHGPVQRRP